MMVPEEKSPNCRSDCGEHVCTTFHDNIKVMVMLSHSIWTVKFCDQMGQWDIHQLVFTTNWCGCEKQCIIPSENKTVIVLYSSLNSKNSYVSVCLSDFTTLSVDHWLEHWHEIRRMTDLSIVIWCLWRCQISIQWWPGSRAEVSCPSSVHHEDWTLEHTSVW